MPAGYKCGRARALATLDALFEEEGTQARLKAALKEAGLAGVRSGHYLQETVMGGGCGAKLDPRNFGGKGTIDRDIYWVKVVAGDEEKAREILRQNGIVPVVEKDGLLDAALRKRPQEDYFGR